LGPTIASTFYEPNARKLWEIEPDELAGELFRRRVSARSAVTVLRRVVRGRERSSFWYPAGGFGRISETISDALVTAGGTIRLGARPRRVQVGVNGDVLVETDAGDCLRTTTVVSTIRLTRSPNSQPHPRQCATPLGRWSTAAPSSSTSPSLAPVTRRSTRTTAVTLGAMRL
jgi:hypothetical protein